MNVKIVALRLLFLLGQTPYLLAGNEANPADVNILILGSSRSFSELAQDGTKPEAAFVFKNIKTELFNILKDAPMIRGKMIVDTVDLYGEAILTKMVVRKEPKQMEFPVQFSHKRYSLAQFYFWPDGREARLANLRGEAGTRWDHVIIMSDPYLLANMPGIYAEGINLIAGEVKRGGAELHLFQQWPGPESVFDNSHFKEITHRVALSAEIGLIPAGSAWEIMESRSASTMHPDEDGAYLAAAAIYSTLFNRNAGSSEYRKGDELADLAFETIREYDYEKQYEGHYFFKTPFSMDALQKRTYIFNHTGTSTERGIMKGLRRIFAIGRVGHTFTYDQEEFPRFDFNLGRADTNYEKPKQYKVNPELFHRSYGFPMGERRDFEKNDNLGFPVTSRYGIDLKMSPNKEYDDGTDLGIAYDMIRQGEVEKNVRCIPLRLMYAKMQHIDKDIPSNRDHWHLSYEVDDAAASYIYTSLSGRYAVGDEPEKDPQDDQTLFEWRKWLARKIGYETAWRMSTLQARVPGFEVLPQSSEPVLDTATKQSLSIRFLYRPKSEVEVDVVVEGNPQATISPRTLTFTPKDYSQTQTVTLSASNITVDISLKLITRSADPVFNQLIDSWNYKVKTADQ